MKSIVVLSSLSTGLDPALASARTLELEDDPIGEGGFGVAYRARTLDGRPITPAIVKLLTDDGHGRARHGLETVRELQRRLSVEHGVSRSTAGKPLLEAVPGLVGVPQLSFEGRMDGRQVVGHVANDLCAAGFEEFGRVLEDAGRFRAFQALPLQARLRLASQLVQAFDFLSSRVRFIHADIKAEALFVDMTRLRCALIDFDSGALARDAGDAPTTFGTRQDWLAPEIVRQLDAPGNSARVINVNLHSDTWSVNVAIHYLLLGCHPLFFLTEISDRSISAYLSRFRWPDVAPGFRYFRTDYATTHAMYRDYVRAVLPREVQERLAFTIERGFQDPSARTSYGQWRTVLGAQNRPQIRSFIADRQILTDGRPVRLSWDVRGAARLDLSGVGDVTARTHVDVIVRRDTTFRLVLHTETGSSIAATARVEVSKAPPVIHRFDAAPARMTDASPVRLAWSVTGAARLSIDNGIGDVTGRASIEVIPRHDTTFTLLAESAFGARATRQVVVTTPQDAPTIEFFRADRSLLRDARPLELSWRVSPNAQEVVLEPLGPVAREGTIRVPQTVDTVYVLRAETFFGRRTSRRLDVRVSKEPPRVSCFRVQPATVPAGSSATLQWSVAGAAQVEISPRLGTVAAEGQASITVADDVELVLTAGSWCGVKSTARTRVTVLRPTALGAGLGGVTRVDHANLTRVPSTLSGKWPGAVTPLTARRQLPA